MQNTCHRAFQYLPIACKLEPYSALIAIVADSAAYQAGRSFYDLNMAVLVQDSHVTAREDYLLQAFIWWKHSIFIARSCYPQSMPSSCTPRRLASASNLVLKWQEFLSNFHVFFRPSRSDCMFRLIRNPFTQDANEVYGEARNQQEDRGVWYTSSST